MSAKHTRVIKLKTLARGNLQGPLPQPLFEVIHLRGINPGGLGSRDHPDFGQGVVDRS